MIRVEKTHLPVAALTHPGMKGKNNEDRFGVTAFRLKTQPAEPVLLAVLSDGIGGHRAGEVASEMAVNMISHYAADSDGRSPLHTLEEAIHLASLAIFEQAQENPEQQGMGATCACAWINGDRLYTATVGDSRIYLMREETIRQLSIDHTWIQEALERGLIQPDQINGHPNAHVIRRYLGSPNPPEVDFRIQLNGDGSESNGDLTQNQGLRLLPGDRLLLCSDGLTDLVNNEEILAAFMKDTLENAGRELINLANERGGHDNITLIAIQIPETRAGAVVPAAAPATARSISRRLITGCLLVVALAILVGGAAGGWLLYSGRNSATPTPTLQSTLTLLSLTRSPTLTRTTTATPTPFIPSNATPTPPGANQNLLPGNLPSLTPVRVNSPTPPLPVVTVNP